LPTEDTLLAGGLTGEQAEHVLREGELTLIGRLAAASNASFLGEVELDNVTLPCIYKPVAGERPLWDFPDGTLAARELAARLVSEIGGWHLVPPTVMRDGRFGPGMCQQWIDVDPDRALLDVVPPEFEDPDWIAVLTATDSDDREVLLVHADDDRLRDLAVLDVVINNADRKGGHLLPQISGQLWGCDHGVSFHTAPKLRTVLWGWAGEPLRSRDSECLGRLLGALDDQEGGGGADRLSALLTPQERVALRQRCAALLTSGLMPVPDGSWPAVPWPAF
jgi:uncharacterized repeat protein (TIGR03843 family)